MLIKKGKMDELKKLPFMAPGTYFFIRDMTWNILDRILVSRNLMDSKGLEADISSYRIHSERAISTEFRYTKGYNKGSVIKGVPRNYDFLNRNPGISGFSHHFPVSIKLKLAQ